MRSLADSLLLVSPLLWAALAAVLAIAAGGAAAARLVRDGAAAGDGEGPTPTAASAALLRLALGLALGLGLLGQALFLAGIGGRFGVGALVAIAALALVVGGRSLGTARRDVLALLARARAHARARVRVRRRALGALGLLAAAALAGPAWLALYPPVAWDDTIYHLPLARSLVEQGRYVFAEYLRVPVFPLLAETLFAPALLLGRASTAHGVSLVATFATALLLLAWGRERFAGAPETGGSRAWALAPAAIWIGQPIVVFYAGSAYVEPILTLFATAAVVACERWREDRAPGWLCAAGAFAGWAAATKYLGLYLLGMLALVFAWEAVRGTRLRVLALFAGAAALAGGPWYALVWALSGNPIFPFLSAIFGASEWSGTAAVAGSGVAGDWLGGALDLARLGWDLVVDRARTNAQPPASALVIAAFPLLLYAGGRRRWTRPWIVILAGFSLAFLALPRDARYFLFFSPLLTVLLVAALRDLIDAGTRRPARRVGRQSSLAIAELAAIALVVLGLATGPAYALWRTSRAGLPPVAPAAIDAFLARRVPLYRALLFRRDEGMQNVTLYALHGERLHDFGGAQLLGDWTGPYRYSLVLPLLARPAELAGELRRLGAAQLLLPRALVAPGLVAEIAAAPQFRVLYRDDEAVLLALSP